MLYRTIVYNEKVRLYLILKIGGNFMKKWSAVFSGMAIATLLLAGCGTANDDTVKENQSTNESQTNTAQTEETNTTETQGNAQTEEAATQEQASEKANEKTLTYKFNNETKTGTAVLKTSDNQPYSIYLLPEFELSGEEPGKDVVLFSGNDSIFMRIELLPDDVDWAATEENVKAQIGAVSETVSDPGLAIENGVAYEAMANNEVVTGVLLKNEKAPVRLTLFTTKDADYRHAFLEMAKTIQKQ